MTTLIAFTPNASLTPPWTYVFTLDQAPVTAAALWNVTAQRWYLQLTDQNANILWMGALVGSPLDSDIVLAPGIFSTSTILYREDTGNFEVTP